jgi:hypothetical protein
VTAWPPVGRDRLAQAVTSLAGRAETPEQRAQLHALAAIVRNLGSEEKHADERAELERAIDRALEAGAEDEALQAARKLAAADRRAVDPVDWAAASGV